jgi:hypothetical protein
MGGQNGQRIICVISGPFELSTDYAINDNADYAHHAERNPRRVSKRGVLPQCGNDSASLRVMGYKP